MNAAVEYTVSQMIQQQGTAERTVDPLAARALAKVVSEYATRLLAPDLESFAKYTTFSHLYLVGGILI